MNLPENAISFSPSLAKAIGLHEAIVVQWLASLSAVDAYQGFNVDVKLCQHRLSFLPLTQLDQIFKQLHQQGYIKLQRSENGCWQGHLCQTTTQQMATISEQLEPQMAISPQAEKAASLEADAMVPEKTAYHQPTPALSKSEQAAERSSPTERAAQPQMRKPENNHTRLRNQNPGTQIHYLKGQSQGSSVTGLVVMTTDWRPSAQFAEMLQFHNISSEFALEQLVAFRVYYVQSGKTAFSWDTRFMNWVQRAWADQSKVKKGYEQTNANKEHQSDAKQRKEAVRQQLRNIHDTSWAD